MVGWSKRGKRVARPLTLHSKHLSMSTEQIDSSIKLIHRSPTPSTPLALCRNGESIYLRSINLNNNNNSDQSPIAAHLSVLVEQDPYPGFTMDGRQMIWVSFLFHLFIISFYCAILMNSESIDSSRIMGRILVYSKNWNKRESFNRSSPFSLCFPPLQFLPLLTRPISSNRVGRTIKQGFVTFPLCVVLLTDKEILQTCTFCERVERVDEVERFKRCGKCKRRFYVSLHVSLPYSS